MGDHLPAVLPWAELVNASGVLLLLCIAACTGSAQTRDYPKEIRGYKVERAVVEVKRSESKERKSRGDTGENPEQALKQSTGFDYTVLQDRLADYLAHI